MESFGGSDEPARDDEVEIGTTSAQAHMKVRPKIRKRYCCSGKAGVRVMHSTGTQSIPRWRARTAPRKALAVGVGLLLELLEGKVTPHLHLKRGGAICIVSAGSGAA